MTAPAVSADVHCVKIGKRALHQLRVALERETGPQATLVLREAGFAGGEALYHAFTQWTNERYGLGSPQDLDVKFLTEALSGFFKDSGWGDVATTNLSSSIMAFDSPDWAEAESGSAEYPSCHFSTGMLADFFTRIAGTQMAVMEVECRSHGDPHCRYLVGGPDALTYVFERMSQGVGYAQVMTTSPR